MIPSGLVERTCMLGMMDGSLELAHEEVIGPSHVVRLDQDPRIRIASRECRAPYRDGVGGLRFAADHVILRSTAQYREQLRIIAQTSAQGLGTFVGFGHFARTPPAY